MKILLETVFDSGVVYLYPPSESFGCLCFEHIGQSPLKKSFLFIEIAGLVYPGVKTASNLHVSSSGNEISHHFLTETLHL